MQIQETKAILSKWIIDGLPDYFIGADRELYRLPFATYPNHYGLRQIKKQPGNRWKVHGHWISQRQLKKTKRVHLNPHPSYVPMWFKKNPKQIKQS